MWLGPPAMKRKITDFAFAGSGGSFGGLGGRCRAGLRALDVGLDDSAVRAGTGERGEIDALVGGNAARERAGLDAITRCGRASSFPPLSVQMRTDRASCA